MARRILRNLNRSKGKTMKRSTFLLAAVLAATLLSAPAWATNPKPPTETQPPPASQEFNVDTSADAAAAAAAKAQAAAQAAANSTATGTGVGLGIGGAGGSGGAGGLGGAGGDAKGGSAGSYSASNGGSMTGGDMSNNSRTSMLLLPAPVWSQVPQAAGCITTSARSGAVGWNFISVAKSDQRSDPACVGIIMAKAAYDHCHFESEAMIMQRVYETLFPGAQALPMVPGIRNHSLAECEDLKRPRLTITPVMHTPAPAPAAVATPVPERAAKPDRQ